MTYHDKRLGARGNGHRKATYKLLVDGAASINIWPTFHAPRVGSVGDDWKAVGDDLRRALSSAKSGG